MMKTLGFGLLVLITILSIGAGESLGAQESLASQLAGQPVTWPQVGISLVAMGVIFILAMMSRAPGLVVLFSLFLSVRYLIWRGAYTLNSVDATGLTFSLIVLVAEIYGLGATIFFYLQLGKPVQRAQPTLDKDRLPTVDVFVTIYNEPLAILGRTLVACQALDYPVGRKTVYVLDDGGRSEVMELAVTLGVVYLNRPTHEHAKAGNLNFALANSTGEIVVCFDTDHVPVRTFLLETVGYFEEPNVALVQTPHHFYNPDVFQRNLRLEQEIVNEQDLFFQVIMPGRDRHNSAFFCGSGGLFRRAPLEEVGGFATQTVTEDIHTSILLHAKGYRSIYVNKRLAAGLAPEDYVSYLRQRQRWARGHLQLFLSRHNPFLIRGLTLRQRLDYMASIYYFLHGPARLIYLAAPLAYLLFGTAVVVADPYALLTFYLAHYIGAQIATTVVTRGFRNPFWADVYETVMSFHLTVTTFAALLFTKGTAFRVTPKGVRSSQSFFQFKLGSPYLVLTIALLLGIGFGGIDAVRTLSLSTASVVSLIWAGYSIIVCVAAASAAHERPQRRESPRLVRDIACELKVDHTMLPGRTFDLSETGIRMFLTPPRALPHELEVWIGGDGEEKVMLHGRVVRNDRVEGRESFVGIEFQNVTDSQLHGIIRHLFGSPASWSNIPTPKTTFGRSFFNIIASPIRTYSMDRALRRMTPRFALGIPCEVVAQDQVILGMTEDMSETGLLVRVTSPASIPARCVVRLTPGTDVFTLRCRTVWQKKKWGNLYLGLRCEEPVSRFLISWIDFVQKSATPRESVPDSEGVGVS